MNRLPPLARFFLAALLLAGALYLGYRVRGTLGSLAAGFILAYVLAPIVDRLERLRIPRALGATLIVVAALGVAIGAVLFVVPAVAREWSTFASRVQLARLTDPNAWPASLREFMTRHQAEIEEYKGLGVAWLKANAGRLLAPVGAAAAGVFSSVASFVVALLNLVVVPIIALYLATDYGAIESGLKGLVPFGHRAEVFRVGAEVNQVLRAFIRGQVIVAVCLGVLYAIGLTIVGTPLGILIGLAAGLLNVVPYLGLAAGLLPALLLNFLEHQSWPRLLGVLLVFVVAQNIEGFVLTPRLVGTSIGLHPVAVVIAIMFGGELFGFTGILLAVPAAAVVSVFVREGLARYKASRLYLGEGPPTGDSRSAVAAAAAAGAAATATAAGGAGAGGSPSRAEATPEETGTLAG